MTLKFKQGVQRTTIDQWTNIPFIGQQFGYCKSFTLTHYLADPLPCPRSIPLCIQHHIKLTSLSFQVSQPSHSWVTAISIFYLESQGHGWGQSLKSQCESNFLSTPIPFVPCQSAIQFLRYDFFNIWPWKSKVKVMGEVDIESHNMGPTFYRLISLSFHVNRRSHSWDTTFSKFDLENPRSRSNDHDVAQLQV